MKVGKIINGDGYIVETVAYTKDSIYMYELQKGETLIKDEIPAGMLKPRWNSKKWEETATEEEIKEFNKVPEIGKTELELLEEIVKEKSQQLDLVKKDLDKEKSKNATIMLGLMDTNNRLRELEAK